jgi:hypothetical protein
VLAAHRQKKPRKAPDPEMLESVAEHLDKQSTPAKGKKRRQAHVSGSGTRRPKWQLHAWTPHMRRVLACGKSKYKLRVVQEHAFPNDANRTSFGREAFAQAKEHEAEDFAASSSKDFDRYKLRVIADTSWGVRGQIKTLAINQVASGYNLEQPRVLGVARTAASIRLATAWTKERVAILLADDSFLAGPHNNVSTRFI